MQKQLGQLTMRVVVITLCSLSVLLLSILSATKANAASNYRFYYTESCKECTTTLTSIKDTTKLALLEVNYLDYTSSSENLSKLKTDCKISQPDTTKAYFFNGNSCFIGQTNVSTEITRLISLQPDVIINPNTQTTDKPDTTTPTDNTNSTTDPSKSQDNPPVNNNINQNATENKTSTQITRPALEISLVEAILMIVAPLTFIFIAYSLIKRLKL